ncbi:MAG: hypothetical protein HYX78_01640 [Armatimonadetes bacterium]|nr:hypothetical protein [Armatimonadota bacterium]
MKLSFARYLIAVLLMVAPLSIGGCASAQTDGDLLSTTIDGCRNAVRLVQSGKGKVTARRWLDKNHAGDTPAVVETESRYVLAFRGDKYKLTEEVEFIRNNPTQQELLASKDNGITKSPLIQPGDKRNHVISFDGEVVTFFHKEEGYAFIDKPTSQRPSVANVHHEDYAEIVSPVGRGLMEIDKCFEATHPNSTGLEFVGREVVDGDKCIVVQVKTTFPFPDGKPMTNTRKFWVNPDKGYTIVKDHVYQDQPKAYLAQEVVTQAREYVDGVWGPTTSVLTQYTIDGDGNRKKVRSQTVTYDPTFQLNISVSDQDLSQTLPSGTRVTNHLQDALYTVP